MGFAAPPSPADITFHTSGPIPPDQGHLYIPRDCDRKLEALLARRDYAAVIGPRLSGKSSLLLRQWLRLRESDYFIPAYISLGHLKNLAPTEWYGHIHQNIARQTNGLLPVPRDPAPHVLALHEEIIDALEDELQGHTLVIMLDQVETTPDAVCTDFYANVREMFVNRWMQPVLNNVCFVLAGRFVPDELIADPEISPFRVTETIYVEDATIEGITHLVSWLGNEARSLASNVPQRIFEWTEGDVYLTHKLCAGLARDVPQGAILMPDVDRAARKFLYEDDIFRKMWRQIQADTDVYQLVDSLLNHREQIRFTLLQRPIMVAWLEGAIKADTAGHCALHSLVHESVLHSLRQTRAETPRRGRRLPAMLHSDNVVLHDRYRIEHVLHAGMLSHVFRGTDLDTDQPVAIKQLMVARDLNEMAWHRFQRESDALRHLDHPNIVKLVDAFSEGGFEYIVMEYVYGGSLYDRLNREGRLPLRQALVITRHMADALHHAHERDIVHRDVKPSNAMLTPDLLPKLADFGVARLNYHTRVTLPHTVIGTTPYLSPEGCQGEVLDARSDIWSLGVVLFEMLAGTLPFIDRTDDLTARAILENDVPNIRTIRPDVPIAVTNLIDAMLTKSVSHRTNTCAEVRNRVQALLVATAGPTEPL